MTNLLWPGDQRAGEHMSDQALLQSMLAVESAWLGALGTAGLAPVAAADLRNLVGSRTASGSRPAPRTAATR